MEPPQNSHSEYQLTAKAKKNNYHNLDKDNPHSQRHSKLILPSQQLISGDIHYYVHIKYSSEEIIRKFIQYAQRKGYKAVKTFDNQLILIDSRFTAKIKKLFNCFSNRLQQKRMRFWVSTDEYKSVRVLQISCLRQIVSDSILRGMLVEFAQEQLPEPEMRNDMDDEPQDLYSLEATSKYMYSKMLLEEGYSMGQKTRQFLDKVGKYSLSKIVDKSIVRWIEEMKVEIVQDLLKGFNCSRKELTEILPFCRTTIEQFLYTRIYIDDGDIYTPDIDTTFPNTVKQIGKLNYILTPYQLQRQFFWITVAYQHQYSAQNQHKLTLEELFKIVKPRNIDGKVELIKAYQQILGENYNWKSTQAIIKAVEMNE